MVCNICQNWAGNLNVMVATGHHETCPKLPKQFLLEDFWCFESNLEWSAHVDIDDGYIYKITHDSNLEIPWIININCDTNPKFFFKNLNDLVTAIYNSYSIKNNHKFFEKVKFGLCKECLGRMHIGSSNKIFGYNIYECRCCGYPNSLCDFWNKTEGSLNAKWRAEMGVKPIGD